MKDSRGGGVKIGSAHKHSPLLIHSLMVLCATLVSTSFTVGHGLASRLDPLVLTFARFLLAALILTPLVRVRYGLTVPLHFILRCAVISATLVVFFWTMFEALRYTSALNTSVIFVLVPSISGIYAFFLVKEKLDRPQLIALLCGMVGAVWVIFRGDIALALALQWNRGDLIFLAGCFSMGFYTPLVRLLHRGEPMLSMTYWVLVTGCCWLLLLGWRKLFGFTWLEVPTEVWLGVGYLAFFTTVVSFFLTQYCILYIGPTRVMAYSYLYPGLVLLLDLLAGHGLPSPVILPGVVIVLLAMVVLQYSASGSRQL